MDDMRLRDGGHLHKDKIGGLHTCFHECKTVLTDYGFWIGLTIGFPIEHWIWTKMPLFKDITTFIGLD